MKRIVLDTLARSPEKRVGRIYKTTSLAGLKLRLPFRIELEQILLSSNAELLDFFSQ